jgi:hypothetical protein
LHLHIAADRNTCFFCPDRIERIAAGWRVFRVARSEHCGILTPQRSCVTVSEKPESAQAVILTGFGHQLHFVFQRQKTDQ